MGNHDRLRSSEAEQASRQLTDVLDKESVESDLNAATVGESSGADLPSMERSTWIEDIDALRNRRKLNRAGKSTGK